MSRPRLCFVVESGTDVRMVEGLAARFDLTVLARRIPGGVEISRTPDPSVPLVVGSSSRAGFAARVWQELRRGRFDHVLVQGYGPAALAANLAARGRTTLLVCSPVERYYFQRQRNPDPGKPFRWTEAMGLMLFAGINARLAKRYVVLSRHLEQVVRAHGARGAVHQVPVYGVDTSLFRPPTESKAVLRQRRGLPPTGALVFFSSRVAPEKDAQTLLVAVRKLIEAGREIWLLHRSGGHRAFLASAQAAGIAGRVIATDAVHPVKELPIDYQASDLLVQASREEGLGFSPLEALACETPVVATAVGGLRETIVDGQTGWTYPVGDSGALATAIAAALDDPAEALRRARAGREMVVATYETRAAFDKLEAILREPST